MVKIIDIAKKLNIEDLPSVSLMNSGQYSVHTTHDDAIRKAVKLIVESGRRQIYFLLTR